MSTCLLCGASNLAGADLCERCAQPLGIPGESIPRSDVEAQVLGDPLGALHPRPAPCVSPDTRIDAVLERLAGESVGCVVVVEEGRAIGIFAERDVVTRLDPGDTAQRGARISELMTPHPETLPEDAPVAFALQRMSAGDYRHIPVTRDGQVVGLVSARDLLQYICERGLESPT
jgi:CBS domain-containing protein